MYSLVEVVCVGNVKLCAGCAVCMGEEEEILRGGGGRLCPYFTMGG